MENKDKAHITEHLANEQTFLAWLRTSIEVMAFGFVAIKFSLFTSQLMGIVLVSTGALMTLLAHLRYKKTVMQLRQGTYFYSSVLLTVIAVILFIISVILVLCVVSTSLKEENKKVNAKVLYNVAPQCDTY
jgi:putative membrane protein